MYETSASSLRALQELIMMTWLTAWLATAPPSGAVVDHDAKADEWPRFNWYVVGALYICSVEPKQWDMECSWSWQANAQTNASRNSTSRRMHDSRLAVDAVEMHESPSSMSSTRTQRVWRAWAIHVGEKISRKPSEMKFDSNACTLSGQEAT